MIKQATQLFLNGIYHIHMCTISDFLCTGCKEESIPRLFYMAKCRTHGADNGCPCISTKRKLQYTSEFWIPVRDMATFLTCTADRKYKTLKLIHSSSVCTNENKFVCVQFSAVAIRRRANWCTKSNTLYILSSENWHTKQYYAKGTCQWTW